MIAESASIVFLALLLDLAFGDPRSRYHPTAWTGALIARLAPRARGPSRAHERLAGACLVLVPALAAVLLLLLLYSGLGTLGQSISTAATILAVGVLLKTTLAVKGMERHALAVAAALEADNLRSAREHLSMIVKRDTGDLDRDHVYSAVVESIGENTVDGITGPLFYFGIFGIFGSFVYRAVNTADSMIGYKTRIFRDIGWFAAACDRVLNYVPSRLTSLVMVLSSMILRNNWRKSYRVMVRDGGKTESPNAGYPMAAIAGALDARLEKSDHYSLGDGTGVFCKGHVTGAIALMKVTSAVFCMVVVVPTMALLSYLGWWIHA